MKEQYIRGFGKCQARQFPVVQPVNRVKTEYLNRGKEDGHFPTDALKMALITGRSTETGLPHLADPKVECLQRFRRGISEVLALGGEDDASSYIDDNEAVQHCTELNRL